MNPEPCAPITVLLVDDVALVRDRLCSLLGEDPRIAVIGQAQDAAEAIRQSDSLRPDAVVLDYRLPDATGVEVLRHIKQAAPWCVVIMLTNLRESVFEEISRMSGADYFFHKATEFEKVAEVLGRLACSRGPGMLPHGGGNGKSSRSGSVFPNGMNGTPKR